MNIRFEQRVTDWNSTIEELFGPCLICDSDIKYSYSATVERYGPEWVEKQFEPKHRRKNIRMLRETGWHSNGPKVETLESLVCSACLPECRSSRAEYQETEEGIRLEKEIDRKAQREHLTWRTPAPGEFDHYPDGADEFRVIQPSGFLASLTFRYRATHGKCRGGSPRFAVGMWADGRLMAHYYAWNLEPFPGDMERALDSDDNDIEVYRREDVFARGFCIWIERHYQAELCRMKPDVEWSAKQRDQDVWLEDIEGPTIVRTRWIDGSLYTTLWGARNMPDLAKWALDHLALRIEKRTFVALA